MGMLSSDEINKRLRAIDNLRMAGVSEDREAQLKSEAEALRTQLNTINAIRTSVGGEAVQDTSNVTYGTPEGGYKPTQISDEGKKVEAAKARLYELSSKNSLDLTPQEKAEMNKLSAWLNQ